MHKGELTLKVNGKEVTIEVHEEMSLLSFLREELQLIGTKNGCGTGHCGACMVLIDGEAKRSCLLKVGHLIGKEITTIEGLKKGEEPHPIQRAFHLTGAIQCGFCTPGFIISTKALLLKNSSPCEEEIKGALRQNICRCTGYQKIIQGVLLAAQWMRDPYTMKKESFSTFGLGVSLPDKEGLEKAKGELLFGADLQFEGMLHGKVLLSEIPHGQIISMDLTKASVYPGVVKILTGKDVPGHNGLGPLKPHQPLLSHERVRFQGEAIALVIAKTQEAALKARDLIKVEYRVLPGVFHPIKGLEDDAPKIHKDGNLCKYLHHQVGDVEEAFKGAYVVVEGSFETPFVEHAYLEPEAGVGLKDREGIITIYAPTQFPFEVRRQLAHALALDERRIRVISTPMGGAFGSRCDITVEGLLALGAYHLNSPVKIIFSREESMKRSAKRHPFIMDYKVAASKEGKITAVQAKLYSDAGPYMALSPRVIDQACIFSCGPYYVPHINVEGWSVYTNNALSSAFRGFGINQVAVAMESLVDELAKGLQLDPFTIRYLNALDIGDPTASGEILKASVAIKETIIKAKERYLQVKDMYQGRPGKRIGVGVASGFKNVGAGKGKLDDGGAIIELLPDGQVMMRVSGVDMGQGIRTTFIQLAVEALGLDGERIQLITGDTKLTPLHGGGVGERQTLISGNAILLAAEKFKQEIFHVVSRYYQLDDELSIKGGAIYPSSGRDPITFEELADLTEKMNLPIKASCYYTAPKTYPLSDEEAKKGVPRDQYRNYPAYAYTTQVAIVEVDEKTGEVKVLKVIAAHDVGRAINPQKIEGQIEGSCLMGQGYALSEEYVVEEGIHKGKTYRDCRVPTILDMPSIETLIIEDPEPAGPFGAKGISEVATVPITPAILNAIYQATGVRITKLPVDPSLLKEREDPKGMGRSK